MRRRILLIEDDVGLARLIFDNLGLDGFDVHWTADPNEALAIHRTFAPDLVLLDVMLPGQSGLDLCAPLRQRNTPIIIISARGQRTDKVRGLDLGADDYITKPFDFEELVARIRAVLRGAAGGVDLLELGDVIIDFNQLTATRATTEIALTHREFEVLRYLADRRGQTVHRNQLLSDVWGAADEATTRSVDFAIARLRKKIESDPHHPRFLTTVHGGGYQLAAP